MDVRTTFLAATLTAGSFLRSPEVAEAWELPSALPGMSVAALVGHLVRATTSTLAYLDRPAPPPDRAPMDAPDYYLGIEGLYGPLDSPLHTAIRQRALEEAAGGPGEVVRKWDSTRQALAERLPAEPPDRSIEAFGGKVLTLDEYLITRLIEIVVHTDDLAASLHLPPPPFDEAATGLVLGCLTTMLRRRHGDLEVIRALSRKERADPDALRAF